MSPADEKNDEVETEVVDETTLEETPVEPTEAVEEDATEADASEDEAAAEAPAEVAEEPVAEADAETPKPKRSRAKKADAEAAKPAEPKAAPARKAVASTNGAPVVKAHAKYVRTSARKARLVADHVRGKSVVEARAILAHTPRAVAEDWEKLLNSAVANAEHNHELLGDDLRILSITADEGPTLKRFRPRAMGRASRIRKRTSHLSIALTPKEQ
jgi:large subunit ribosomal protein L22